MTAKAARTLHAGKCETPRRSARSGRPVDAHVRPGPTPVEDDAAKGGGTHPSSSGVAESARAVGADKRVSAPRQAIPGLRVRRPQFRVRLPRDRHPRLKSPATREPARARANRKSDLDVSRACSHMAGAGVKRGKGPPGAVGTHTGATHVLGGRLDRDKPRRGRIRVERGFGRCEWLSGRARPRYVVETKGRGDWCKVVSATYQMVRSGRSAGSRMFTSARFPLKRAFARRW